MTRLPGAYRDPADQYWDLPMSSGEFHEATQPSEKRGRSYPLRDLNSGVLLTVTCRFNCRNGESPSSRPRTRTWSIKDAPEEPGRQQAIELGYLEIFLRHCKHEEVLARRSSYPSRATAFPRKDQRDVQPFHACAYCARIIKAKLAMPAKDEHVEMLLEVLSQDLGEESLHHVDG
jgi:hypothetical protein